MAHHKSAIKRIQLQAKQNERNRKYRSQMRKAIRNVRLAENKEDGLAALTKAYATIDKLISKGIIHKNTGANKKSGLTRFVNTLA